MFHCSTATVSVRNVGPLREHKHTDGLSHVLIAVPIMFCSRSPDFNQSFLEFILERRLIDLLLHDPSVFVIGQIEVRAVGGATYPERRSLSGVSRSNSSIVLHADALVCCPGVTRWIAGSTLQ